MVPLNVTVLEPREVPKLLPETVTEAPTAPEVGERLEIDGPAARKQVGVKRAMNETIAARLSLWSARFIERTFLPGMLPSCVMTTQLFAP